MLGAGAGAPPGVAVSPRHRGIGRAPREERRPAGAADGELRVGAVEQQRAASESVEVGRLDVLLAIASDLRAEVIDDYQQDNFV